MSDCWQVGGQVLTQSEMSWGLCQPTSGQGWDPAGPRVGSGLLLANSFYRLQDHSFLVSGACHLLGEPGLETCLGFLAQSAGAYPLVAGSGSWSSHGQGHT